MGDPKVGELVKKIQKNESKVGKVWRSARFGQEECTELEQERCWQELERINSSSALTTSLEDSGLGRL